MGYRTLFAGGALLVLLSACVSTEKFEASEAGLATCRSSLEQCRTQAADQAQRYEGSLRQQASACDEQRQALEERLGMNARDVERCRQEVAAAQANTLMLGARAAQLRRQLQAEIAARDVEIEDLRDQLSVRVLDRILFHSGSAEILAPGRAVLDKVAAVFVDSDEHIRVEGHTDIVPIGAALQSKYPTNWELSTARASSVVRYFETVRKIDPHRLEAVGFSKYRPVAQGDTPEALQRNRRVEIVVTAGKRQ